ncbi:protein bicaudal C homolog 1-like isoform X2 [Eriocheir sinensis]|uniref:protein bicaudal C homolog 1-like isoform X2 n=1 Tax=Eriocheir sinensis TaxID=95602 RepID=UPI0021C6FC24|nr:protein bicaudal C homolog 1-like isoform X2 [Eriocheir sinensis]
MDALAGDIEIHLPPDEEEDPHVRVTGSAETVKIAGSLVRQYLEPPNRVTMKMDVSWTHHSHIIGKGGNTIQPVVKRTGVTIHFPDGNKSSEMRKSNQVSINSRGEDLHGLEEARKAIRSLTPLDFNFTILSTVQFSGAIVDSTMLVLHVQSTFGVKVELRVLKEMTLVGVVRGSEEEAQNVIDATKHILQAYCCNLANQVPIQMTMEVSPQHHAFVMGRNHEHMKRIMHRTSTNITFPDWNDSSLPQIKKSTITISGSIENVYLARQNIIGSLPLVLMFDLAAGTVTDMAEVTQMMQMLDVQIIIKTSRPDGRRPVVVKAAERNAENLYEAWRMLNKVEATIPKASIPSLYHVTSSVHNLNSCHGLVGWTGGDRGDPSPLPSPSPTNTPTPPTPQLNSLSNTSLWGGLTSSVTTTTLLSHPRHDPMSPTSTFYNGNPFCNGAVNYNNNNNSNHHNLGGFNNNNNYILPPPHAFPGSGGSVAANLDSFVLSMKGISLANGELSCGTSTNSGSSFSSPSHSPCDSPPDQTLLTLPPNTTAATPTTTAANAPTTTCATPLNHFSEDATQTSADMDTLSALLKDLDWRAPGCEKNYLERVAAQKTLSDYSSKKVEAARAMKQDVGSNPRTPTSSWSGYGFSKSMPGFMIRQKLQEAKDSVQNGVARNGLEEWGDTWQQKNDGGGCNDSSGGGRVSGLSGYTSPASSAQTVASLNYHNMAQVANKYPLTSDKVLMGLSGRPDVNLSASNFMDCVLKRRDRDNTLSTVTPTAGRHTAPAQHLDITSILTDIELPQYIDMFTGQEVDLNMFMTLEDHDLKELGITIFGHRKRILMAIKEMSCKLSLFGSGVGGRSTNRGLGGVVSRVDHRLNPSTLGPSTVPSGSSSSSSSSPAATWTNL